LRAPSPTPLPYTTLFRSDAGMRIQLEEVRAIADNPAGPTFENTLVAMERSGQLLDRAQTVFFALVAADTNDARNQLRSDYAPRLDRKSTRLNSSHVKISY